MTGTTKKSSADIDIEQLFRAYSRELNQYAYRRLKDRESAADVVQDGFVRFLVWDRASSETVRNARFFLWRIVGNLTMDLMRRARVAGPRIGLDDVADHLTDPAPTADRLLEQRQNLAILKSALDEMPSHHRTALLLNRLDGMTHAEIAARLGRSSASICRDIMAALEFCIDRLPSDWR